MHSVLQAIMQRRSVPVLQEPAPTDEQVSTIISAAMHAPDHRQLRPWRFMVLCGEQRAALGRIFAKATEHILTADGSTAAEHQDKINKALNNPLRAPLIIVVRTCVQDHPMVPYNEQVLSTGAAIQNMLLAIRALGFDAIWRTGDMAENPLVKNALAFAATDVIAGFIYVGTAGCELAQRDGLGLQLFMDAMPYVEL